MKQFDMSQSSFVILQISGSHDYFAGSLSEENRLFLEAWRTLDRAYVDKTFNGQSWFRYRENALRNEPMNTREETCMITSFCCYLVLQQ